MSRERDAEAGAGPPTMLDRMNDECGQINAAFAARERARRQREADEAPAPFGWVAICGRCREPMRPKPDVPGVNDAAECPRCGLIVPGVVVRSRTVDLPPNLTPYQIRGVLTNHALRLCDVERRLALLESRKLNG